MGNHDGQPPALVVVPFGRVVAELSRKASHLGHVMLANSWEVINIAVFWEFIPVLRLKRS